jgi:glutathione-independent formaldehyde dehydrogenase
LRARFNRLLPYLCRPVRYAGMAGAAYGFAGMGPYAGGQAQYLRVPYADFNCLQLPEDATSKEKDYVMLSDIFPTGWHSTRLADLNPGESILIYGAGPVGLMALLSARIHGASQIFIVDGQQDRLALAKKMGDAYSFEGRKYRRSNS